jgi:flavin reductase (DIM6/NTAB) family NADH-FMN oxidoreductase RutF
MTEIDPKILRRAFGSFMTGVTVVTTVDSSGEPVGFTANSFSSVSLDPPLLLVCPAKSLSSFELFNQCTHFNVSVLAHDQQAVSNNFASAEDDRFSRVAWRSDENGCPKIDGAIASFSCERYQSVDAGDHIILLGKVSSFEANDEQGLGYGGGGYFSLNMERKATEVQTSEQSVVVGAIVEQDGRLFLSSIESDSGQVEVGVPEIEITGDTPSFDAIEAHLSTVLGSHVNIGSVYSIFDHDSENKSYIYYSASIDSQCEPFESTGMFHELNTIDSLSYASKTTQDMLSRYVGERSSGNHRVYVGSQSKGKTHRINRGL